MERSVASGSLSWHFSHVGLPPSPGKTISVGKGQLTTRLALHFSALTALASSRATFVRSLLHAYASLCV